ncbi:hypothetical protein BDA99DRAFT_269523 [Phascolomyces articulosus]|uniref:Uncharacterized protein n=1 Tax=Phascolomyces articulosus TaxID=60185 RepID=A0AAD5JMH3_9FUNG|nr:hypothetical protein BDA99DRAFT_269523 [Phascolomyces articulosus]
MVSNDDDSSSSTDNGTSYPYLIPLLIGMGMGFFVLFWIGAVCQCYGAKNNTDKRLWVSCCYASTSLCWFPPLMLYRIFCTRNSFWGIFFECPTWYCDISYFLYNYWQPFTYGLATYYTHCCSFISQYNYSSSFFYNNNESGDATREGLLTRWNNGSCSSDDEDEGSGNSLDRRNNICRHNYQNNTTLNDTTMINSNNHDTGDFIPLEMISHSAASGSAKSPSSITPTVDSDEDNSLYYPSVGLMDSSRSVTITIREQTKYL